LEDAPQALSHAHPYNSSGAYFNRRIDMGNDVSRVILSQPDPCDDAASADYGCIERRHIRLHVLEAIQYILGQRYQKYAHEK